MLLLYVPVLAIRSLAESATAAPTISAHQPGLQCGASCWAEFFAMAAVFTALRCGDAVMIFILWALGGTVVCSYRGAECSATFAGLCGHCIVWFSPADREPDRAAVAGASAAGLPDAQPAVCCMFQCGQRCGAGSVLGITRRAPCPASLASRSRTAACCQGCLTFAALCLGLWGCFCSTVHGLPGLSARAGAPCAPVYA